MGHLEGRTTKTNLPRQCLLPKATEDDRICPLGGICGNRSELVAATKADSPRRSRRILWVDYPEDNRVIVCSNQRPPSDVIRLLRVGHVEEEIPTAALGSPCHAWGTHHGDCRTGRGSCAAIYLPGSWAASNFHRGPAGSSARKGFIFGKVCLNPTIPRMLAGQAQQGKFLSPFHIIQIAYFLPRMSRPRLVAGWQAGAENGGNAWNY